MFAPYLVAGSALRISARGLFDFTPLRWAGAGCSPRRATHFLLLRQKKVSKEKATPLSASPALRAPLEQPRRVSSRSTRAPTRVPPRNRPAAGAARRGLDSRTANSRTATRAIAALGPAFAARGACARETGPSAAQRSNGPCGCPFLVPFCERREAQGRGCVRVPKDTRTSCTESPQLFERSAAGAQRVLRWHSLTEHRRLPRSAAKGTRAAGSLSLW